MPPKKTKSKSRFFISAQDDAGSARLLAETPQCLSSSYKLAYQDEEFILRDELRPVRLQLELLKPELILQENHIESTVVIFGSARIPDPATAEARLVSAEADFRKNKKDATLKQKVEIARRALANSKYYEEARKLGGLISSNTGKDKLVVITGGGPGIMEAANRGAHEAGIPSIGMNIVLPFEQAPNPYITPELSFQFHYFAIRKMLLLMRARALAVFPGGFGTLDELFETMTLIQTQKVKPIPVLLFGQKFWERVINFNALVEEGTIASKDLDLFEYVETAEEAWKIISQLKSE
ncbi:MAG: TIGR00730 family Rossman fold protein [Deltaproteobacteria bacterium]|nr:TIGR00730 family Rossman fold protein [Deltaproteobacteria bacterium]